MRLVRMVVMAAVCGAPWDAVAVLSLMTRESPSIDCSATSSERGGDHPSEAASLWRIEGAIKKLDLLHRTLEINGVALSVDVNSVILIDCKRAPLRELREGGQADVVYKERDGLNTVIVLEAEGDTH